MLWWILEFRSIWTNACICGRYLNIALHVSNLSFSSVAMRNVNPHAVWAGNLCGGDRRVWPKRKRQARLCCWLTQGTQSSQMVCTIMRRNIVHVYIVKRLNTCVYYSFQHNYGPQYWIDSINTLTSNWSGISYCTKRSQFNGLHYQSGA
jgi:hypothetical protein